MDGSQDSTTTTRRAESDAVTSKALALAARYDGAGRFTVASGSTIGRVYVVAAPRGERNPEHWSCSCDWAAHGGRMCSHVRAAARELARLDRAAGLARAAERGGRELLAALRAWAAANESYEEACEADAPSLELERLSDADSAAFDRVVDWVAFAGELDARTAEHYAADIRMAANAARVRRAVRA